MAEAEAEFRGHNSDKVMREEDNDDSGSEVADEDLDEELALPDILSNLGVGEKRELLRFKESHTEIEWEEEILRRTDLLARKIDLERLKKMTKGATMDKTAAVTIKSTKRGAKVGKAKKTDSGSGEMDLDSDASSDDEPVTKRTHRQRAAATEAKAKAATTSKEEAESGQEEEDSAEEDFADLDGDASGVEDNGDDLFDTDEEEEITNRFQQDGDEEAGGSKSTKSGTKRKIEATKSSRLRKGSKKAAHSEEDEDYASDQSADFGTGKSKRPVTSYRRSKYAGSSDEEEDLDDSVRGDEFDDDSDVPKKDEPLSENVEDYWRIQIRRGAVSKYVKEPFFENFMKGGFVKILIGQVGRVNKYRVGEIVGIEQNLPSYKDHALGMQLTHRMTLRCGKHTIPRVKYEIISESRITEDELKVYIQGGGTLLTQTQIDSRRKKQQQYMNHVYTHEEIKDMVQQNTGFTAQLSQTDYATAVESLKKKLADAMSRPGEEKLVMQLSKAIEKIEEEGETQKQMFNKATRKSSEVNERNRRNNELRDSAAGLEFMIEEAMGNREELIKKDPFSRRETRPKILWKTSNMLEAEAAAAKDEDERKKAEQVNKAGPKAKASQEAVSAEIGAAVVGATEDLTPSQLAAKKKATKLALLRLLNENAFMAEIRKNVKGRLGVDPIEIAQEPLRTRYLRKATAGLPPVGSEERQRLKGNSKTWEEVLGAR